MGWNLGKQVKHCRWCGILYNAAQPLNQDGFCCPAHKQAHYRAYKKYVTAKSSRRAAAGRRGVTRKKRKK